MSAGAETEPVTMTITEACRRHAGLNHSTLQIMCIRKQIRAQKVGKRWHIPVAELDRVFLGIKHRR